MVEQVSGISRGASSNNQQRLPQPAAGEQRKPQFSTEKEKFSVFHIYQPFGFSFLLIVEI